MFWSFQEENTPWVLTPVTEISYTVSWTCLKVPDEKFLDQRLESYPRNRSGTRIWPFIRKFGSPVYQGSSAWCSTDHWTHPRHNPAIETIKEEATFGGKDQILYSLDNGRRSLWEVRVDRIDRLKADGAIGVVSYKSSLTQFQFPHFFNGLNSQLPTYLAALKRRGAELFGAMYLEMAEPSPIFD